MDEKEKRRRTFIIAGTVFLLVATLVAIYFIFFHKRPNDSSTESPTLGEESGDRFGDPLEREQDRKNGTGVFSPSAKLRLISEEPVAGAITIKHESGEIVRILERKTSHVFDVKLSSLEKDRISNTTIPRIYEALWGAEGKDVILRYLSENNQTIKTYYADLIKKDAEATENETPYSLSGKFLRDNITQIAFSPDKSKIFWLTETIRESQGVISNLDGSGMQAVFRSDYREWLPQWYNKNNISMTTKASGVAPGFSYTMPSSSGTLSRSLGNVIGLTTLVSPSGRYILYSQSEDMNIKTYIHDTSSNTSTQVFIRLIPEKCVWRNDTILYCGVPNNMQNGLYPDIWYQGKTLFTDSIFRIDATTNTIKKIYSPDIEDDEAIDIYKPLISESGEYLLFNNKADMSFWAFTLEEKVEI